MKKLILKRGFDTRWYQILKEDIVAEKIIFSVTKINFNFSSYPTEEELRKNNGMGLKPIRIDGRYPQPPDFHYKGNTYQFHYSGNSGIKSRNGWFINIPTVKEEILCLETSNNCEGDVFILKKEEVNFIKTTIEYYNRDFLTMYNEFVEKFKRDYELSICPNVVGFTEYKEANKTLWYERIEELDGKKFIILNKYHTSCGNVTLFLHPKTEELIIPDDYKGIVIGKGGSNIKFLCNKYKMRFKIK